jgi:CheY-like chemotaxis protein
MNGKRVLVVEDNALNMKLFRILLGQAGYDVMEAGDAETALRIAREQTPHLILMDIQLPGMDGLGATRLLKQDETLREVPIVAVTSYAMPEDQARTAAAGCCGYVSKPIDTRHFVEYISQFIP